MGLFEKGERKRGKKEGNWPKHYLFSGILGIFIIWALGEMAAEKILHFLQSDF